LERLDVVEPHEKLWVKQVVAQMDERELSDNILLFLQHVDSPDNKEATLAGYKLFLWAEKYQEKDGP
jgi:hypothetical protein